ncbi:hypothetical protein NCER_100556 [Vairimorpha ceranae BRL01]|uniref:Rio-like serine-threonine protein kinase n=2 Tax=Vairimorpha ceranae TaxID=40302 RepID=C4V7W2_VAIC1|nr:rio-like serine-threonine protein kinase [Vairimorpha ceranae]EEQ82691.1 hypothetical protein NCER_100556 [Vairimorpha ceranae BRL01]KAF5141817.1 hypothetical protein G9O61_00g001000 [Vairimorpha ceranae]KKO74896.1 rio-like serine-threonine protein kinase [Vairimorpha ceranae]
MDEFKKIEEQRKRIVKQMTKENITRREEKFKELERKKFIINNTALQSQVTENNDINTNIINPCQHLIKNEQAKYSVLSYEPTVAEDSSFDKNVFEFNVNFEDYYIKNYLFLSHYFVIEKQIQNEKDLTPRSELLKIKIEVNKRLNQLNNDYDKIYTLYRFLNKYSHSKVFLETFVLKILEQSIIQVSRYYESYRQYSLCFKFLYNDDLFTFYKIKLFSKKASEEGLKGLYAVFFGVIKECDLSEEAWAFSAGFLNVQNSEFVILEIYLDILGEYVIDKFNRRAYKLFRYIKNYTLPTIKNLAHKYKIEKLIDRLLNLS